MLQLSTIYLPINAPYDRPTILNSYFENIGCYLILSHASYDYEFILHIMEAVTPSPISKHSVCEPVPYYIYSTKLVISDSVHTYLIP